MEDAVDIAAEIGFDEIEWNVRVGGHIEPERVEQDLPRAVELTQEAGMAVRMITTSIQDANSPHADAILSTASGLGIKVYRGGGYFRYDYSRDIIEQLDEMKPRVATLEEINGKYGIAVAYHTHSSLGIIGGNIWDFWYVLKDFDPQLISLNYDIGHATARSGLGWIDGAHLVVRWIRALAVKDPKWTYGHRDLDLELRAQEPESTAQWGVEWVPLGEGMVDFPGIVGLLRSNAFSGPINIHFEHHDLLGTNVGEWELPISRAEFMSIVKKDLDYLRDQLASA